MARKFVDLMVEEVCWLGGDLGIEEIADGV